MPALEDITYSDNEKDVGAEPDFSNLETNITISPIPTTRVHKDNHVTQIIGDLSSTPQTRRGASSIQDVKGLGTSEFAKWTMDTTIEQQAAMDEALVPHAQRDMLHICLRVYGQSFDEPPFEEEILAFIHFLGHSVATRMLTDVNINKLYQPWRSFAAIINKCLTGKSFSYDNLRLSQAQILRNKVNWHYVRDDHIFSTIKLAYKEYYAIATGEAAPKPKASVRRTRSSSDTSITPPTTTASPRLTASAKGKQTAKASKAKSLSALSEVAMTEAQQLKLVTKRSMQQTHISQPSGSGADEGTSSKPGVPDVPTEESKEELSWNSTDDEGDEEGKGDDGEEGNGDDDEEGGDDEQEYDEEEEYAEETRDEESFDPIPQTPEDSKDEDDGEEDLGLNVSGEFISVIAICDKLRSLEANFSEAIQTNQFAGAVSTIPGIVYQYMKQRMNEAVKVVIQIQSDHHQGASQRTSKGTSLQDFSKDEQAVNEQLEAKVLTRSSYSSKTSYAVAVDLSEMELKKILIEKMEGNKSIQRSDEQRNLYKALVDAYESNKIILDTYGETVTLKRRCDDDADKDEEPPARPDRGSKRRREGKEPESASALTETATRITGRSTQGSRSRQASASDYALAEEPMLTTSQTKEPSHPEFDTGVDDQPIVQSSQHPEWFSQQQKPPSLDRDWNKTMPAVHGSPTYELMKGSCKSLIELEYHLEEVFKATTDQLDWVNPEDYGHIKWIEDLVPSTMWIEEPIGYDKHALWGVSHWGRKRQQFYGFAVNRESARDVYSKRRIIVVIELKIIEWHIYKHLDWITMRRTMISFISSRKDKDKRNRLMRIDELHKFSDGTLTDVRTALDDRLKGIRMQYLPQSIWRKSDKDRAAAMIQAIDKRLKTRRIMRSLEQFVGGRLVDAAMELKEKHQVFTAADEDITAARQN
nr:hypothetical protein [Tanacetum cinerariifolium]